jgi:hypothetical protein
VFATPRLTDLDGWELMHTGGRMAGLYPAPDPEVTRGMLFFFDRSAKVRVERWSRARVALLGDSVFGGSVGMGTSMALVGAYILAGEQACCRRPDGESSVAESRSSQGVWS